jgi:hypothetical protein
VDASLLKAEHLQFDMRETVASLEKEYRYYKGLAERAMEQLGDEQLAFVPAPESNSIAVIVWHVSGNLKSRFTDFLTTDGEKEWRHRDSEFEDRTVSHDALREKWNDGWDVLFATLSILTDDDLARHITIRGEDHSVERALHRSVAHTAYHVGQIVFLAKMLRGDDWRNLSMPRRRPAP